MSNRSEATAPRQQRLEEFAARSRFIQRSARLDEAAAEALTAFAEDGIEALVLKGAALAQHLYAPERERGYFDVDILVDPAGYASACAALLRLGYVNVTAQQGPANVADRMHAESWAKLVEIGNLTIDLHWRLDGCTAGDEAIWGALCEHRADVTLAGRTFSCLDRTGMALHAALHLAQHGVEDTKAAGDLTLALHRWPEQTWVAAALLADACGAREGFAAGLRLLPDGAELADRLELGAAAATLWDIENSGRRPRGVDHLEAWGKISGSRARAGFVFRALFPSRAWIRWEMRWAERGQLALCGAYLVHILRSPWLTWRAWAFRAARRRELAIRENAVVFSDDKPHGRARAAEPRGISR